MHIIAAYFLGSIPTAYLVGKWLNNTDIRTQGSGNVGTMNARLVYGWFPALLVLVVDILKGCGAVYLARCAGGGIMIAAFMAVIGHIYPVWLKFHGGKGLATGFGALTAAGEFVVVLPFVITFVVSYFLIRDGNKATFISILVAGVFSIYLKKDLFLLLILLVIGIRHLTVIIKRSLE